MTRPELSARDDLITAVMVGAHPKAEAQRLVDRFEKEKGAEIEHLRSELRLTVASLREVSASLERANNNTVKAQELAQGWMRAAKNTDAERDSLQAEVSGLRKRLFAVQTVKCWTNEDGKRFVFADDLAAALRDTDAGGPTDG